MANSNWVKVTVDVEGALEDVMSLAAVSEDMLCEVLEDEGLVGIKVNTEVVESKIWKNTYLRSAMGAKESRDQREVRSWKLSVFASDAVDCGRLVEWMEWMGLRGEESGYWGSGSYTIEYGSGYRL